MKVARYLPFLLVSILLISCSKDDDKCQSVIDGELKEVTLDEMPTEINPTRHGFGYEMAMDLKYPAQAREDGIEGLVLLQFAITVEGIVEHPTIIQDIGGGCGDAVLEAFQQYVGQTLFHPGIYRGEAVETYKQMPAEFKLE